MKIKKTEPVELKRKPRRRPFMADMVDQFIETGWECARLDDPGDHTVISCLGSAKHYAETRELPVRVYIRNHDCYMERTDK